LGLLFLPLIASSIFTNASEEDRKSMRQFIEEHLANEEIQREIKRLGLEVNVKELLEQYGVAA
jgi:hypothetical protein